MAELAAIGLASNLLQFADLGVKLFQLARESYESGSTAQYESLRDQARSAKELAETTRMLCGRSEILSMGRLRDIGPKCDAAATGLMELLTNLEVDVKQEDKGYKKAWKAFAQALQHIAHEKQIKGSEEHLRQVQIELQTYLVSASLKQQSDTLEALESLRLENEKLEAKTATTLGEITQRIREISSNLQMNRDEGFRDQVSDLKTEMKRFNQEESRVKLQQQILQSLLFHQIKLRQEEVPNSHYATFDWVFQEGQGPSTCFPQWLKSDDDIFWILGKPGSGKSTLMKFLAAHRETRSRLQKWAGGNRVVIANHFFWIGGNSMQKSQRGLLQTLLYKVLKEVPHLIEFVCRSRWTKSHDALSEHWNEVELLKVFEDLTSTPQLPMNFCFFVDGLDEYTAGAKRYHGTFEELFQTLYKIASVPSVKLCVSSRPWTQFTESLGPRVKEWQLQMEDLTRGDIENYVEETLGNNTHYRHLAEEDPRCNAIIKQIVRRAEGIFLWVNLVVQSLENGLIHEDTYEELQRRLDEVPADLEGFFQKMLESIESVYWDSTSRYFKILVESEQTIPLLAFEFLDREAKSPQYAMHLEIRQFSDEDLEATYHRLKKRLHARCKDLVNVTHSSVGFLHRTARDFFIDTGAIDEMEKRRATSNFNPSLSLCRIMLALSKAYEQPARYGDGLMHFAKRVEEQCQTRMLRQGTYSPKTQENLGVLSDLLDDLDRSGTKISNASRPHARNRSKKEGIHWVDSTGSVERDLRDPGERTFLAAAIQAGLLHYVKNKIVQDPTQIKSKKGRPLLDYALRPTMNNEWLLRPVGLEGPVSPIVKLLLENGAEPNEGWLIGYNGMGTPWQLFLTTCHDQTSTFADIDVNKEGITETIISMITHEADRNERVWVKLLGSRQVDILGVARKLDLSGYDISRIEDSMEKSKEQEIARGRELKAMLEQALKDEEQIKNPGLLLLLWSLLWPEKQEQRGVFIRLLLGLWSLVWQPRK